MTDLDNFIQKLKSLCSSDGEQLSIESARAVVSEINRFLYTTYDGIGTVNALGNEWQLNKKTMKPISLSYIMSWIKKLRFNLK